jgi:hypothetical protein
LSDDVGLAEQAQEQPEQVVAIEVPSASGSVDIVIPVVIYTNEYNTSKVIIRSKNYSLGLTGRFVASARRRDFAISGVTTTMAFHEVTMVSDSTIMLYSGVMNALS